MPRSISLRPPGSITAHFLWYNYVALLYEAGCDPLIAMRLVGHSDYQTMASIQTHLKDDALKKAAANIDEVFSKKSGSKAPAKAGNAGGQWGTWGL